MIKLDHICEQLEDTAESLIAKVKDIYRKADGEGRKTTKEEDEYIDGLLDEIEDICIALVHLQDHCEVTERREVWKELKF